MARHDFTFPLSRGAANRQAHVGLPAGTFERELGREGFFGPASHMLHTHAPTGWSAIEGPLRPRAFNFAAASARANDPFTAPVLLRNEAVEIRFWRLDCAMPALARNADGDTLLFVHEGDAALFCDYGHLALKTGDYLLLPRGTLWRLEPSGPCAFLMIEATGGALRAPERGLVGRHALYDPAVLDVPALDEAFRAQQGDDPWTVHVKRRGQVSLMRYPFNPLDAVGWHGDLAPIRLNVADLRPLMSHRYHVPPSAHATFVADRFVVCTFVPRPFETDPEALKVPFFHSNDDFDEVLFYHAGDFFSRDGIAAGMVTLHPSGLPHGPHPKALRNALTPAKPATDEFAVMIDTRDALTVMPAAETVERAGYAMSWQAP